MELQLKFSGQLELWPTIDTENALIHAKNWAKWHDSGLI